MSPHKIAALIVATLSLLDASHADADAADDADTPPFLFLKSSMVPPADDVACSIKKVYFRHTVLGAMKRRLFVPWFATNGTAFAAFEIRDAPRRVSTDAPGLRMSVRIPAGADSTSMGQCFLGHTTPTIANAPTPEGQAQNRAGFLAGWHGIFSTIDACLVAVPCTDPAIDPELAALVDKLGDDDWATREAAQAELTWDIFMSILVNQLEYVAQLELRLAQELAKATPDLEIVARLKRVIADVEAAWLDAMTFEAAEEEEEVGETDAPAEEPSTDADAIEPFDDLWTP